MSLIHGIMSAAFIEMQAGNYEVARERFEEAEELWAAHHRAMRGVVDQDKLDAIAGERGRIRSLTDMVDARRGALGKIEEVRAMVEAVPLTESKFSAAVNELRKMRGYIPTFQGAFRESYSAELEALKQRLDTRRGDQLMANTLREIDEALAKDTREGRDEALAIMERKEEEGLRGGQAFSTRREEILNLNGYEDTLDRAVRAERSEDYDRAIRAYEDLLVLAPKVGADSKVAEFEDKIREIKGVVALRRGELEERRGRLEAAISFYKDAQRLGNSAAARKLGDMDIKVERGEHAKLAENRFTEGDYRGAIEAAEAANRISVSQDMRQLIQAARIEIALNEARQALASRDFDAARRSFRRVRQLDRGNAEATRGLSIIENWVNFNEKMSDGDEAINRRRFGAAIQAYREASMMVADEQAKQRALERMVDAQYQERFNAAQQQKDARNYRAALSAVEIALSKKQTAEAQQLKTEIERQLEAEGS